MCVLCKALCGVQARPGEAKAAGVHEVCQLECEWPEVGGPGLVVDKGKGKAKEKEAKEKEAATSL